MRPDGTHSRIQIFWKYTGIGYDLVCFTDGKIEGTKLPAWSKVRLQGLDQTEYIRRAHITSAKRRLSDAPLYPNGLDHQSN
jgi:hypothetical protein